MKVMILPFRRIFSKSRAPRLRRTRVRFIWCLIWLLDKQRLSTKITALWRRSSRVCRRKARWQRRKRSRILTRHSNSARKINQRQKTDIHNKKVTSNQILPTSSATSAIKTQSPKRKRTTISRYRASPSKVKRKYQREKSWSRLIVAWILHTTSATSIINGGRRIQNILKNKSRSKREKVHR